MTTNTQTSLLTVRQAAVALGCCYSTVIKLINGRMTGYPVLKHYRVGRKIIIKSEWIEKFQN
tara:strand:- start:78 stop:263 length:186 start_codon:yes stop_codon:yes gene_type:complete